MTPYRTQDAQSGQPRPTSAAAPNVSPARAPDPHAHCGHVQHGGHARHGAAAKPGADAHAAGLGAAPPSAPGTIYTCPMHPEIRRTEPGTCPICGMALEPLMPSLDEEENPELTNFSRRFWWTLPLTLIVVPLAMFGHRLTVLPAAAISWAEFALSTPVILWAGWPFFVRGMQSIRNRSPNMWTLIGLGVAAAFAYSATATIAPQLFPAGFIVHGRVGVYFEAAAVIVSLTLLGQVLELRRWRTCTSATGCACGRARRCRSTAWYSKARAASTNRC